MGFDGWTLALQAINFLVLVWILQRFLYKPLLALVERRRQATESAFAEAAEQHEAAEAERADYQTKRQALDSERQKLLEQTRAEIQKERDAMRERARAEAESMLAEARTRVERERETAAGELLEDSLRLAGELATKLLGGVGSRQLAAALLTAALDRLDALPDERRAALGRDVAAGARVTVAASHELEGSVQDSCRGRLERLFGGDVGVDFAVDEALIAGAELRFAHAVIGYSWRDSLAGAVAELARHDGAA